MSQCARDIPSFHLAPGIEPTLRRRWNHLWYCTDLAIHKCRYRVSSRKIKCIHIRETPIVYLEPRSEEVVRAFKQYAEFRDSDHEEVEDIFEPASNFGHLHQSPATTAPFSQWTLEEQTSRRVLSAEDLTDIHEFAPHEIGRGVFVRTKTMEEQSLKSESGLTAFLSRKVSMICEWKAMHPAHSFL